MSVNLTVNATQEYQTITGFGTSLYSGSTTAPYDDAPGSAPYQNFINDYVNDLGANLLRIDFDPDVLPVQPATPLGTNLAANIAALNFQSPNALFYGSLAQAINTADGGKLQVLATIWTPPAWMKANDSLSAVLQPDGTYNDPLNHLLFQDNTPADAGVQTNNLDPTNLSQFARYCAAYVAGMEQTYGINIVGLSIQNEPLFNEPYVSCSYFQDASLSGTDIQYRRYAQAVQAVGEEFLADGLSTTLVGPESVGPDLNTNQFTERQMAFIQAIDDDTTVDQFGNTAAAYLGDYAIHGWGTDGTNAISGQQRWTQYETDLNAEPYVRPSWQTEESGESQTWTGTNSDGTVDPLAGALGMALQIHDTLTYGDVSAYYYLSTTDGNLTGTSASSLMDSTDATVADPERTDVPQWKYLTFKHWSDFVDAGSVRVGTTYTNSAGGTIAENASGVNSDAYLDSAAQTLTLELTNESSTAQTINLSLKSVNVAEFSQSWLTDAATVWGSLGSITVNGGVATLTVPAYSVVTLVGSTAVGSVSGTVYADANDDGQFDNGDRGIAGESVYLDLNKSGAFAAGDPETLTTSTGSYSFPVLDAGNYIARVTAPGWSQTEPADGNAQQFTVVADGAVTGVNFGLVQSAPTANAGGPYTLNAGSQISLNGSASAEVGGSIASYEWDLNYNGTAFVANASGPTPVFSAAAIIGPTTEDVALEVIDANGVASPIVTTTVQVNAVSASPLTGTVIGTSGSYKNDGNTAAKAFDGSLTTFFDGPTASGNWVGLDLGSARVITSIAYASRSGWASRMDGGVFQGSNSSTFATGVVNFYTIAVNANPSSTALTTQSISNSNGYRYVRYFSPANSYGDVAEVQFFGKVYTGLTQFTGAVIGTSGSYQNDGNTIAKAVDGNLSTFFDGPTGNGNWVGLDLGSAQVIKQISYAPRVGWANRMIGGIFQVSNSATFSSGVVNLYTITTAPAQGVLTTVSINVTTAYRYVRYLSPNGSFGDISEFQIFG
jgi:O-glycosyl hydrolase